jgi:hypothetical protein
MLEFNKTPQLVVVKVNQVIDKCDILPRIVAIRLGSRKFIAYSYAA